MPLTPKQAAFVAAYVAEPNATKAAITAGYSAHTADVQGPRLLGNVAIQQALKEANATALQRVEASQRAAIDTAQRIIEEAAAIGFSDLRNVVEWDGDTLRLKDSAELTPAAAAAIKAIKVKRTTRTSKDGEDFVTEEREVQLWDKIGALNILKARHHEFRDNQPAPNQTLVLNGLNDEQLDAVIKRLSGG